MDCDLGTLILLHGEARFQWSALEIIKMGCPNHENYNNVLGAKNILEYGVEKYIIWIFGFRVTVVYLDGINEVILCGYNGGH